MEQLQVPGTSVSQSVLNWLLEESEPSARYHTLTHLLGKSESDSQVENAKAKIGQTGWVARSLAKQKEDTYWDNPESCYVPKFSATAWRLVVLADLGVSGEDRRIKNCVDHFMSLHNVESWRLLP